MSTSFQNKPVAVDSVMPAQSALTNGKTLVSNGSTVSWNTILGMIGTNPGQTTPASTTNAILPAQSGNTGMVLTTNGANATWASIPTTITSTFTALSFSATQGIPVGDSSTVGYTFGADSDTGLFSPIVTAGRENGIVSLFTNSIETLRATPTNINIPLTAASTSQTTGALTISGGLGVAGAAFASTAAAGTSTNQLATTSFTQTSIQTLGKNSQGNKTLSTAAPTGGSAGDIWYQY